MATEEEFEAAVEQSKSLPKNLSNEDLLGLYGLYKQATQGDVSGSRPGRFKLRERAKYDAWASRKGTSIEDARSMYIAMVHKLGS